MSRKPVQRRQVLHYAVLSGCTAVLPAVAGCQPPEPGPDVTSKPQQPPASGSPAAEPDAAPAADTQQAAGQQPADGSAAGKVSQAQVNYQQSPNGDQKCATCTHFVADSKSCNLVQGAINPAGWCQLWAGS